jgi:hypothetical protein
MQPVRAVSASRTDPESTANSTALPCLYTSFPSLPVLQANLPVTRALKAADPKRSKQQFKR